MDGGLHGRAGDHLLHAVFRCVSADTAALLSKQSYAFPLVTHIMPAKDTMVASAAQGDIIIMT